MTATEEEVPEMRILEKYQNYCPGCSKGRNKIVPGGTSSSDTMPCQTCRPEDHAAWETQRELKEKRERAEQERAAAAKKRAAGTNR
jgi:hypothetical protein